MTGVVKKLFYLIVLILIASAIGSHQNAYSITSQDPAQQASAAKGGQDFFLDPLTRRN